MPELIVPAQTGFLKDQHINQGFLYAQEVVTMATKQKKLCLFKTDLYKAFDTLSWNFLKQVMQARDSHNNGYHG
jgi:hypothetical protein